MRPRLDRRQLPPDAAEEAINVWLTTGGLRPVRQLSDEGLQVAPGNDLRLAEARAAEPYRAPGIDAPGDAQVKATPSDCWLAWHGPASAVRSPVAADRYSRLYWTEPGSVPRVTWAARMGVPDGMAGTPASVPLGVPPPASAPIIEGGGAEPHQRKAIPVLYTIALDWTVYQVNPATGAATAVGSLAGAEDAGGIAPRDEKPAGMCMHPVLGTQRLHVLTNRGRLFHLSENYAPTRLGDTIGGGEYASEDWRGLASDGQRLFTVAGTGGNAGHLFIAEPQGGDNRANRVSPEIMSGPAAIGQAIKGLVSHDGKLYASSVPTQAALARGASNRDGVIWRMTLPQHWSDLHDDEANVPAGNIRPFPVTLAEGDAGQLENLASYPDGDGEPALHALTNRIYRVDIDEVARTAALVETSSQQGPGATQGAAFGRLPAPDPWPVEWHVWVHTYVTSLGEEGPPSPPSAAAERALVGGEDAGVFQAVTVRFPEAAAPQFRGGATEIVARRLYRAVTTTSGEHSWRLVTELRDDDEGRAIRGADVPIGTTSVIDQANNDKLTDALPSLDWDPPHEGLQGLTAMPNGMLCGFTGNTVWVSEPHQPHAWPLDNSYTLPHDVVALAATGTSVAVLTQGHPHLLSGTAPATLTLQRIELPQACVSAAGVANFGLEGVMYPSPDGLVLIGPGGAGLVTEELFDRESWQRMRPAAITAFHHDGAYLAFTEGEAQGDPPRAFAVGRQVSGVALFDLGRLAPAARLLSVRGGHHSLERDELRVLMDAGLWLWEGGPPAWARWTSPPATAAGAINASAAQVLAAAYPAAAAQGADPSAVPHIRMDLLVDGVARARVYFTSAAPHWLPAGYRGSEFQAVLECDGLDARIESLTVGNRREMPWFKRPA